MSKCVLFFIIFIFIFCSSNKSNTVKRDVLNKESDKILWCSYRKLKWDDFKANPDTARTNAEALTYCEIAVAKSYTENDLPKFIIECSFIKSKSWSRTKDLYVLSHEQLHFDLHEIYARKIRKAFDSLNIEKIKDYKVYNTVYIKYGDQSDQYNDLYDSEVYFDEIKQKLWVQKITKELEDLKKYQ